MVVKLGGRGFRRRIGDSRENGAARGAFPSTAFKMKKPPDLGGFS